MVLHGDLEKIIDGIELEKYLDKITAADVKTIRKITSDPFFYGAIFFALGHMSGVHDQRQAMKGGVDNVK